MGRFDNRVAVVTGGSRGIGFAIVKAFAEEGAKVAILDINQEALAVAEKKLVDQGFTVFIQKTDISSTTDVNTAVNGIIEEFGKIDILVNNAGVTRDNLLFKMTESDWETVMDVHLKGTFIISKAIQTNMVENGYGRIINISSTSALGNRGQANYSAAKAGLQGFTKTLAIELGKFGITTNSIAPGFIVTDMTKATATRMGLSFEEYSEMLIKDIPVQRSGKPEDVANTALFLADENSSFVNGQVIYVAGGPTI